MKSLSKFNYNNYCKLILVSSVGRAFDFYTAADFSCKSSKGIEMSGVRAPYEEFFLQLVFSIGRVNSGAFQWVDIIWLIVPLRQLTVLCWRHLFSHSVTCLAEKIFFVFFSPLLQNLSCLLRFCQNLLASIVGEYT